MGRIAFMLLVLESALLFFPTAAMTGKRYSWMADDDGDGVPNGDDSDYIPLVDGTGHQRQNGKPIIESSLLGGILSSDWARLQLQLQDGNCGDCPDTCGVQ
jgi:hypothetical protein